MISMSYTTAYFKSGLNQPIALSLSADLKQRSNGLINSLHTKIELTVVRQLATFMHSNLTRNLKNRISYFNLLFRRILLNALTINLPSLH